MPSRSFGGRKSRRPSVATRVSKGVAGEVLDLRQDVEAGFAALEAEGDGGLVPTGGMVEVTTSPFTVLPTHSVLIVDTTSIPIQLNLFAPGNVKRTGPVIIDKKNTFGTNNCTLHRAAGEKIDNVAADKVLNSNGSRVGLITDGTDWYTP